MASVSNPLNLILAVAELTNSGKDTIASQIKAITLQNKKPHSLHFIPSVSNLSQYCLEKKATPIDRVHNILLSLI